MKIALIGSTNSRKDAPYDDPSWDIWAHACLHRFPDMQGQRVTRWFDVHAPAVRSETKTFDPQHKEWLAGIDRDRSATVVVQPPNDDIPQSMLYPRDAVKAWLHQRGGIVEDEYYTSTLSEMITLALYEGATHLGIWGCTFAQKAEYRVQRPCVEYWIGFARGRGVRVDIAPTSPLCRSRHVYGFDGPRRDLVIQPFAARRLMLATPDAQLPPLTPIPPAVQTLINEEAELFGNVRERYGF